MSFHYTRARHVSEALRILAGDEGARLVAGGTDLSTLVRDGIVAPTHLVDVNGLGLDGIEWPRGGGVRIGALCRNAVDDPRLRRAYPVLVEALRSGASPQIRNRASFGGNLLQQTRCAYFRLPEFACNRRAPGAGCSAARGDGHLQAVFGASPHCVAVHPSDLAVALQALDAVVVTEGPRERRRIPVDRFFRLPGATPHITTELRRDEVVTAVELPDAPFARRSRYVKFRERASYAFALVSAAVAVEERGGTVRSARIALGGVAAKPWRSTAAEQALVGRRLDEAAIAAAGDAATAGARPGRGGGHKVELVRRVVRQALTELG
ncbi:xanthine dehydrogenase family protein subunit M [Actinomadura kijaniata]|uniref:Xanthine dehydrogenase YagS FAD-binding subunit n=1 Tax=Actinomadura namibiensis TaxID=182080 RepID=A0A7W3QQE7_ACTNM|nr:xanthine dehydrogenase family protein subunit M [Actinomadura namibiensis]MBA8955198.1 xanthine dehydrogenase YagS FAD-binding subunit [Actinomadura namibiensis]